MQRGFFESRQVPGALAGTDAPKMKMRQLFGGVPCSRGFRRNSDHGSRAPPPPLPARFGAFAGQHWRERGLFCERLIPLLGFQHKIKLIA